MIIFTEEQIRQSIQLDERAILVVENGFTSLARGEVQMPPIMRVDMKENHGEVDVKTAYIKGLEQFAIKISSGFFNNHQFGLPSGNGMMLLLSTETGIPESVLLDNGYLTDVRTAAAGAICTKYLAPKRVHTAGVIGTGTQAQFQILALDQVRQFEQLYVYGRNQTRLERYVQQMKEQLPDVQIYPAQCPEEVVKKSDVVITTTPAQSPVIQAEWLHPGLHITAMGSDAEHKQEIASEVFQRTDLLACDVKAQCYRLGELRHGLAQGTLPAQEDILELGELTAGKKEGRKSEKQMTLCDLTGTGVQDTAIAIYAYHEMKEKGFGLQI